MLGAAAGSVFHRRSSGVLAEAEREQDEQWMASFADIGPDPKVVTAYPRVVLATATRSRAATPAQATGINANSRSCQQSTVTITLCSPELLGEDFIAPGQRALTSRGPIGPKFRIGERGFTFNPAACPHASSRTHNRRVTEKSWVSLGITHGTARPSLRRSDQRLRMKKTHHACRPRRATVPR